MKYINFRRGYFKPGNLVRLISSQQETGSQSGLYARKLPTTDCAQILNLNQSNFLDWMLLSKDVSLCVSVVYDTNVDWILLLTPPKNLGWFRHEFLCLAE